MHLIVHDVPSGPEVHRINDFVVAVIFVAVKIFGLPTVSYI